jgi:colanic acid biosynthesis glycosyl transferase WcaI
MHILFLSHYFPPEVNAPAVRTYEHCKRWVAAGNKVTVITCAPNCPDGVIYKGYKNRWRHQETVDGIKVIRVWTYVAPNRGFIKRTVNYLSYMVSATLAALTVRRVDVIVATSPQFFCGWAGVLCKRLKRRPFVLEIRDIWPESIVTVGAMKKSMVIRALERLEKKMYCAADHIVTVGEGYKERICARGINPAKVSVVLNGVDVNEFKPIDSAKAVKKEFGSEGRFVCAYIGTIGMAHGLEVVLDAAERYLKEGKTDIMFWIVGDGAHREKLEKSAQKHHLTNVVFTGRLPRERMPEIIEACDACLVHLHGTELFSSVIPSKIFELLAMNVPIIMGVRGQALDIVLEAGAGVAMEPDSAESLAECIEIVRTKDCQAFQGREYAAKNFDRGVLAQKMLEILKNTFQVCHWHS